MKLTRKAFLKGGVGAFLAGVFAGLPEAEAAEFEDGEALVVRPGDTVIIQTPIHMSADALRALAAQIREAETRTGVRFVALSGGFKLGRA